MNSEIIQTSIENLKSHLGRIETDQIILICDKNIEIIYAPLIEQLRDIPGKSVLYWSDAIGEQNKTLNHYSRCVEQLLSKGIHRHAHLVAIGGGALSDFAGLVAATLLRGIAWSVIPTTLLAQVDAAIGGKTAINSSHGKNLLGRFHFPQSIFLCGDFLLTLEPEEYQSGLGEVVKYALLSPEIFTRVVEGRELAEIILQCAQYKQKVVANDPWERRERRYLNLGHTFGHAYEFLTQRPHGISVLWGIEYIDKKFLNGKLKQNYDELLSKLQFRPHFFSIEEHDLLDYLQRDKKKTSRNEVQLVLLEAVGRPYLKTLSLDQLRPR